MIRARRGYLGEPCSPEISACAAVGPRQEPFPRFLQRFLWFGIDWLGIDDLHVSKFSDCILVPAAEHQVNRFYVVAGAPQPRIAGV